MNNCFNFIPQYNLGVASNDVLVYSKCHMIGYIEAKHVPSFNSGNRSHFRPINDWKITYSKALKIEMNLETDK